MSLPRRRPLAALLVSLVTLVAGCAGPGAGDETYRPALGQAGKDVMWVPTLDALVMPMLEAARVGPDDIVWDLGSGDGKIPIAAAQRFGARAVGVEYDAQLSALAQRNAERAGVTDRVRMVQGDLFAVDFSDATVVTLYIGQELNMRVKPRLLALRPGTRIVSNLFDLPPWEPDRTIRLPEQNPVFLWVVPARVGGTWRIDGAPGATLRLEQIYQTVRGTLQADGGRAEPIEGRLDGDRIVLERRAPDGSSRRLAGRLGPDGVLRLEDGPTGRTEARRTNPGGR